MDNDVIALISKIKSKFAHISVHLDDPDIIDMTASEGIRLLETLDAITKHDCIPISETIIRTDEINWYSPNEVLPNPYEPVLIYTRGKQVFESSLETKDVSKPTVTPEGKISFPKHEDGGVWYRYHFCDTLPMESVLKWTYMPGPYPSFKTRDLLDKTVTCGNKVYIITDWHMIEKAHDGSENITIRPDYHNIIKHFNDIVTPDDTVICLGDLLGRIDNYEMFATDLVSKLNGHKIMIIGNNDYYDTNLYKRIGFEDCMFALEWRDVLFTHCPIKNKCRFNVHGHLHVGEPYSSESQYWSMYDIEPKNHINAYNKACLPIDIHALIATGPNYTTAVTNNECPDPVDNTTKLIKLAYNEYKNNERLI